MNKTRLKNKVKENFFYLMLSKPTFYLKKLILGTLVIGFSTLCINILIHWLELDSSTIPTSMHSLIGIVIGLLLVFRTNTAYDRWWEGRKIISDISYEIGSIGIYLNNIDDKNSEKDIIKLKKTIIEILDILTNYLKSNDNSDEFLKFHFIQKKAFEKCFNCLKTIKNNGINITGLNNSLGNLLKHSNALERIKDTPIPLSYRLHIKISLLIYLLTLPFGMFHDLGIWSTPLVMVVYYIIAGVEIISNEIENPFAGDPNDLPLDELFSSIKNTLSYE